MSVHACPTCTCRPPGSKPRRRKCEVCGHVGRCIPLAEFEMSDIDPCIDCPTCYPADT